MITLLTEENGISLPKALAVYDRHLYYMDPRYDKLERVMLDEANAASNPEIVMDNESDLKYFVVFKKRQSKCTILTYRSFTQKLSLVS